MKPLVSVDCITYNHKDYIKDALDGFVMQKTNFPFEVLIHDDASTDGTQDILREYEKKYPELFKVIYEKENQYQKHQKSWTHLMKNIQGPRYKGKYVAFCEGDDYWTDPNKLQIQANYMENNPDCSCVCHAAAMVRGGKFLYVQKQAYVEADIPVQNIIASGGLIATPTMMAKTEIVRDWPKFRQMADVFDYTLKVWLGIKGRVHFLPETMTGYRLAREGSWTQKVQKDPEFMIAHHIKSLGVLAELNKETKRKYAAAISSQAQYYVNGILQAGGAGRFPQLAAFIESIQKKQAEIQSLRSLIQNKSEEAEKLQAGLFEEFIYGAKEALGS